MTQSALVSNEALGRSRVTVGSALTDLDGGLPCVCGVPERKEHLYRLSRLSSGSWLVVMLPVPDTAPVGLWTVDQTAYFKETLGHRDAAWREIEGAAGSEATVSALLDPANLAPLIEAGRYVLLITSESPVEQAVHPLYSRFSCAEVRTLSDEQFVLAGQLGITPWAFRSRLHLPRLTFSIENGVIDHVWPNITDPARHVQDVVKELASPD